MSTDPVSTTYIWFDLEFTDLNPHKASILQVAILATDVHLNPLTSADTGLNLIVRIDPGETVSPWVEENLPNLLARCRSTEALDPKSVEQQIIDYVARLAGPVAEEIKERPVLAGNSVHNDWRLADMHYPRFVERLHYRLMDVSTLKLHWQDWLGNAEFDKDDPGNVEAYLPFDSAPLAGAPHDAYYDILASIAELNFYRRHLLAGSGT